MSTKRRRRDDGSPPGPQMNSSSTASQQRGQATQTGTDSLVRELRASLEALERVLERSDRKYLLTSDRLIETAKELGLAVGRRDVTIIEKNLEIDLLQSRLFELEASKDRTILALQENIQQVKQNHEASLDKVKGLKERARKAKLALGEE